MDTINKSNSHKARKKVGSSKGNMKTLCLSISEGLVEDIKSVANEAGVTVSFLMEKTIPVGLEKVKKEGLTIVIPPLKSEVGE